MADRICNILMTVVVSLSLGILALGAYQADDRSWKIEEAQIRSQAFQCGKQLGGTNPYRGLCLFGEDRSVLWYKWYNEGVIARTGR